MNELIFLKRRWSLRDFLFCVLMLLWLTACGDSPNNNSSIVSSEVTTAVFSVQWHTANSTTAWQVVPMAIEDCGAAGIATVSCDVYDAAGTYLASGGPWLCSAGSGRIEGILPGPDRIFAVRGSDDQNNILYYGRLADVDITSGAINDVGTIDAFLFKPEIIAPIDDAPVTVNAFALSWVRIDTAHAYRVMVSEQQDFETTIIDETTTEWKYTPLNLSPSRSYYWKVYALDIFSNTSIESETGSFTTNSVVNEIPQATIDQPKDAMTFNYGEAITFSGNGKDAEDGDLSDGALVWTSSLDGQIGTGVNFSVTDLSAGKHTITLAATDTQGAIGTAVVEVTVQPPLNEAPSASITAPGSNNATFIHGEEITFTGSATDAEDGDLTGDALIWTSSLDGQIGTGVSFKISNLSLGTHTITLTATDAGGASGSEAIQVGISPSARILLLNFRNDINNVSSVGYSALAAYLRSIGFAVEQDSNVSSIDASIENYDIVVYDGEHDRYISDQEAQVLRDFVENQGGGLLLMADYGKGSGFGDSEFADLNLMAAQWGIEFVGGMVCDEEDHYEKDIMSDPDGGVDYPFIYPHSSHPAVQSVYRFIYNWGGYLKVTSPAAVIASTNQSTSWVDKDCQFDDKLSEWDCQRGEDEPWRSSPVMAVVEPGQFGGKVVAIGDADMWWNWCFQNYSRSLASSIMRYLSPR